MPDDAGGGVITAVALVAQRLVELRDRWLNPPERVEWVDEPVPGYPKRPVSRGEGAQKRTLTNLYTPGRVARGCPRSARCGRGDGLRLASGHLR